MRCSPCGRWTADPRLETCGRDAQDRVDWAVGGTGLATPVINSSCPADPDPDDDARVTVTYEFTFITPVGVLAGLYANGEDDTVGLTGKGVMPCRA